MNEENINEETKQDVEKTPVQETGNKSTNNGLWVFVGVVVAVAASLGGVYYYNNHNATTPLAIESGTTPVSPDTVRATVNGEEITQKTINDRLNEAAQTLSAQGVDLSNPDTRTQIESKILDDTINYTVLKQEAIKSGIEVEQSAVDELYQTYVTQAGDEDKLATQLGQVNLTVDAFKTRLEEQLRIDSYLRQNNDFDKIVISDEEISDAYNNAIKNVTASDTVPTLQDVRPQIIGQLTQQKQQELVSSVTASLRQEADIQLP